MPIKISPASNDAAGIAFGKRKAQGLIRRQREDDEFKRTLHKVFYLGNGTKVTLNARGGTIHVTASALMPSTSWMAYEAGYSHLMWFRHAVINKVHFPSHKPSYPGTEYGYDQFAALELAAMRSVRDLNYQARLSHISAIRADMEIGFNAGWLLGSVFSALPAPKTEVIGPYFIRVTNDSYEDYGTGTLTITIEYSVFDGQIQVGSGIGQFVSTFLVGGSGSTYGVSLLASDWPSCVPMPVGEYHGFTRLPISSTEVVDGYLISGSASYTPGASSGNVYVEDFSFHRVDAVSNWLIEPTTIIDGSNPMYSPYGPYAWSGSTGDKSVRTGSIVHVYCLEYLVSDNVSASNAPYWTPFIELCYKTDYIGEIHPDEVPSQNQLILNMDDLNAFYAETTPQRVLATSVRLVKYFAKKLTKSAGGLADRSWIDAPASTKKSFMHGVSIGSTSNVIGSFGPVDPWGLPEMVVVIEDPNGSFQPASNSYSNAVNQKYAKSTPYEGGWSGSNTTDEIRAMIMSEVLSMAGFI